MFNKMSVIKKLFFKMDSFSVFVEFTRYRYSFYALNADVNVYNGPTIQDGTLMNYDIESKFSSKIKFSSSEQKIF